MRIECIGGPLDGEIRVTDGEGFYMVGQGMYLVPRLFGRAINVALDGSGTAGIAHAFWHPEKDDA